MSARRHGPTRRTVLQTLGGSMLLPGCARADPIEYNIGLFVHAARATIRADVVELATVGFERDGSAAARYRHDPQADFAFVSAHPRAAFMAADGRVFRLIGPSITVEQLGAKGDGVTNDQPAIQAAVAYAEATGLHEIGFAAAAYAVWTRTRVSPHASHHYDGEAIIISKRIRFLGLHPTGSTLFLRNVDGRGLDRHWQTTSDGAVWRGSGLMLRGHWSWDPVRNVPLTPAADYELPSITLVDMTLDGGVDRGPVTDPVFPADRATGNGWDWTHKGIYGEEDTYCGDIMLIRSKIVRFRGELIYQGGELQGGLSAIDSYFAHSSGDLINPAPGHGQSLLLRNCVFENGYQAFEGWGGRAGRIENCTFRNCFQGAGRLQGGLTNAGAGAGLYYRPKRVVANEIPWLTLKNVRFIDCGLVGIGSWVRGDIYSLDSQVTLLTLGEQDSIHDVDLTITAAAERRIEYAGAALNTSTTPGLRAISDIRLVVFVEPRSGQGLERAVTYVGSFGANVIVEGGRGTARRYPTDLNHRPDGRGHDAPDVKPCFRNNRWTLAEHDWSGSTTDVDLTHTVVPAGDHHLIYRGSGSAGPIAFDIDTSGYQDGHELLLKAAPQPTGAIYRPVDAGVVSLRNGRRSLGAGQVVILRFHAASRTWREVEPGESLNLLPAA